MSERRFQLILSAVFLLGTIWYAVQMASYPANSGRVPLIVALVVAGCLVVQMVGQFRALRAPESEPVPVTVPAPGATASSGDPLEGAEERVQEVEGAMSGYQTLLALDRVRRTRFIAIVLFSILFYVGALMVGFVLTTGVLITAFLLIARERLVTALAAGLVGAAAVYVLVVMVIGLPALDGYLF
jgi:hypothetical protein